MGDRLRFDRELEACLALVALVGWGCKPVASRAEAVPPAYASALESSAAPAVTLADLKPASEFAGPSGTPSSTPSGTPSGTPSWMPSRTTALGATAATAPALGTVPGMPFGRMPTLRMDSGGLEAAITARLADQPLATVLARRTRKPEISLRAASVMVEEARRLRVSPSLLAGVLLTENGWLDTTAVSSQGAVGLMQVMPLHAGSYGCGSSELRELESNICHGARVLHTLIVRSPSVPVALVRYNGCTGGSNIPRCRRYVNEVLRNASRVRRDMVRYAATQGVKFDPPKPKPEPKPKPKPPGPPNPSALLRLADGYAVQSIAIGDSSWLRGRPLKKARLDAEGLAVLGIRHPDGRFTDVPGPDAKPEKGDALVVYGRRAAVEALAGRIRGPAGDKAHDAAVARRGAATPARAGAGMPGT